MYFMRANKYCVPPIKYNMYFAPCMITIQYLAALLNLTSHTKLHYVLWIERSEAGLGCWWWFFSPGTKLTIWNNSIFIQEPQAAVTNQKWFKVQTVEWKTIEYDREVGIENTGRKMRNQWFLWTGEIQIGEVLAKIGQPVQVLYPNWKSDDGYKSFHNLKER